MRNRHYIEAQERVIALEAMGPSRIYETQFSGVWRITHLNAANEVAVQAFLDQRLPFTGIAATIERTLEAAERTRVGPGGDLETILSIDAWARAAAGELLNA